nr:MAG TPA: hypothetical protein [Caudoviricetes sp.]
MVFLYLIICAGATKEVSSMACKGKGGKKGKGK